MEFDQAFDAINSCKNPKLIRLSKNFMQNAKGEKLTGEQVKDIICKGELNSLLSIQDKDTFEAWFKHKTGFFAMRLRVLEITIAPLSIVRVPLSIWNWNMQNTSGTCQIFKSDCEERKAKKVVADIISPTIKLDDVILNAEKRRLLDCAIIQAKKHKEFRKMGFAKYKSLTLCFSGPSGTGKTLCAEAVAKQLSKKLMTVNYSEIESKWIGSTEKNIARVFKEAEEQKAVLFFDEADTLACSREFAVHKWDLSATNVLLKELEKFQGVCIFATNHKAKFDPSFERRLSIHIEFNKPKQEERLEIWKLLTKRCKLPKDIDLKAFSQNYDFTGGDIKNALVNAGRLALLDGDIIEQKHLEEACKMVKGAGGVRQSYFG